MSQQLTLTRHNERVAFPADANPVDHAPQFFEIEPADQPTLVGIVIEPYRNDRSRKQVVVHREIGHECAFNVHALGARNAGAWGTKTAGDRRDAVVVEQGQLTKFRKLQNEILEDSILLPCFKTGLLKVGSDRLENFYASGDVQLDLFRCPSRHVEVSLNDSLLRSRAKPQNRDGTVCQQRDYRRCGHQQCKARGDLFH